MSTLRWKINRLQRMGLPEISYRIRQMLKAKLEASGIGRTPSGERMYASTPVAWLDKLPSNISVLPYLDAANRILAGRWDVFSLRDVELGFPPTWNRDPKSGRTAPLVFGKTLNYRDESLVGDIKYLWEPNRHLELVTLAQAYHLSGEMCYAEGCRILLESWFQQCPYPLGPNWTSSLEHAVRLTNWAVAWHLLGGEHSPLFASATGAAFQQRWLESVYLHCHFIAGHFSRFSSANNHLLGEYMGLFIAALNWPCWKESARWRDLAMVGLENETRKQNAPDGVNREQATWYHHEVADMMLLCGLFGRANDYDFSARFWSRLEAMLTYIAAIMDVAGQVPMIGDADDALMVRFTCKADFNPFRSLLATGAVLFERADFAAKAQGCDDKTRWLLGDAASGILEQLIQANHEQPDTRRAFAEGGYFILGDCLNTPDEIRLVIDAGPLGYLSIAAHGHADALAFTLSVAGREMLIDPGTYAYHTQKRWRNYFRGTAAHNTLRIDGLDQSEIGGNFMWLNQANARNVEWRCNAEIEQFSGEHDGYIRLDDPVLHRRGIRLEKTTRQIRVTDYLDCAAEHLVELHWHFHESCRVTLAERVVMARHGAVSLEMCMPDVDWVPSLVRGLEIPPLGWVSRRFDEKTPTTTVAWRGRITAKTKLSTDIKLSY